MIKRRWQWLAVGSVAVVVLTGAVITEYWDRPCGFDRAAFDHVIADLPPPPRAQAWHHLDVPAEVGSCEVLGAYGVKGGYIFSVNSEEFTFDHTGFGYFPDGPTDDLENGSFESPRFRHIEGAWYDWTASW